MNKKTIKHLIDGMMARKTNETMEGRNVRINDRMERWIEGMMDREKKDGQKEQWIER